ncbi:MAG: branched-chain amino acid transport system ATP-binding protein, partial [Gammaproteobacteria bacterium]
MQAINIIKREHLSLAAVLYSLEQLIKLVDDGSQADFKVFHGLLTYIDRFLDRYHHPREDQYIFPTLLERDPDSEALVVELGLQHRHGESLFIDMQKALSAWEFIGKDEFPRFRKIALDYTAFERKHAHTEEREVLPRAQALFTESDWKTIDAAFAENADPMFGSNRDPEFAHLFEQLVNQLPTPLG